MTSRCVTGEERYDFVYFMANEYDRTLSKALAILFILKTLNYLAGFEFLTVVTIFWIVTHRNSVRSRSFGGTYGIHLCGRRVSQARNYQKLSLPRTSGF
jgi:hypothetical protein